MSESWDFFDESGTGSDNKSGITILLLYCCFPVATGCSCFLHIMMSDLRIICFLVLGDIASLSELNSSVPAALGIGGTSGRGPVAALKRRHNQTVVNTCDKNTYHRCTSFVK